MTAEGLFDKPTQPNQPSPGTRYSPLMQLLAAVGVPLGKTRLLALARQCNLSAAGGLAYTGDRLAVEIQQALAVGEIAQVNGGMTCAAAHVHAAFREVALSGRLSAWRPALWEALHVPTNFSLWARPQSQDEPLAIMRIAACSGMTGTALRSINTYLQAYDVTWLCFKALCQPFDAAVFELVAPVEREVFAERSLMWMLHLPNTSAPALVEWVLQRDAAPPMLPALHYRLCEHLLWQGRFAEALDRIQGDGHPNAMALRAAAAVMRREAGARERYERAFDALRTGAGATPRSGGGKKAGLLPLSIAWLYAAELITSGAPAALEAARRYCRAEMREIGRDAGWVWQHLERVADTRLGDPEAQAVYAGMDGVHGLTGLITLASAAWVKRPVDSAALAHAQRCANGFAQAGYAWAARECEAAIAVLGGAQGGVMAEGTLAGAFANEQTWRRALEAITALSEAQSEPQSDTRLVWMILMARDAVQEVEPWEQKRGPRGWNKGKRATYARLTKADSLTPQDARACATLHRLGVSYVFDIERTLLALAGHPLVFFAEAPDVPVELVVSDPELAVTRGKSGLRVALNPDLRKFFAQQRYTPYGHRDNRPQAERCLLVKDTPTRARVVRVTPAHKRVAELVGESLAVPEEGAAELSRALDAAARLFRVHSAIASALPEAAADGSLRAELAPAGDGLRLRLAVQPFATDGPRYAPGTGGARVIAEVAGERRAAVRDLAAERTAAAHVLEALPLLDDDDGHFEWHIAEAEDCLMLVETLQGMSDAVRIEWPAGVKFKVTRTYGAADFQLNVKGNGDWFAVSGGLKLDEGLVIDMGRLIELASASRGRFVPMGEGGFVALSDDLRRRIDELGGLGEATAAGIKVHALAAGALEALAEGANWTTDKAWTARMDKVREAQTLEAEVPSTLQAELRSYQAEGFRWLARLAHWGAGACLADDMGLGKTVQTLALLLRRAPDGPALVVAPTSVCSLWGDEARRFAPTLNVVLFGSGERDKVLSEAGPYTVLVCSYTLLQQEIELFTAREWHTVVLDEAQMVKNFATKRAQAVFALKADFRIATTGTPVENRLDELWTLFRFLNAGLLGARERFNERFAAPIERGRDAAARVRLRRLIRPFILRRTKSEVLSELPPRTEIVIQVEPEAAERAFHEALRRDALATIEGAAQPLAQRRFQVLAQLMRLRRACCDPRLVTPGSSLSGAKLEAFAMIVDELVANKHKALVFSQFVDYLTLLRGQLDRMGVSYQYLDGSTPAPERARAVAAFQKGEGDMFLISLRAGGFGLNLTAADYVIIADPWWNPAVEDQAAARAHRMGQERPVTVYRLVVKGSVEERIMAMHQDKRALAEGLFTGEEFGGAVSVDELVRLMREDA